MATIMRSTPLNISFRRPIIGPKLHTWNDLILRITNLQLNSQMDIFRWNLNKSGLFTIKSFYGALISNFQVPITNLFWLIKIPLKVQIFLWYIKRGVILTKDNLLKRN